VGKIQPEEVRYQLTPANDQSDIICVGVMVLMASSLDGILVTIKLLAI